MLRYRLSVVDKIAEIIPTTIKTTRIVGKTSIIYAGTALSGDDRFGTVIRAAIPANTENVDSTNKVIPEDSVNLRKSSFFSTVSTLFIRWGSKAKLNNSHWMLKIANTL